ncbi:MAG: T9SS type A sorting domain-containing protein [Deferribacteres bacterium]|nr:T9SS type A sorting domain-containing protein [candidate division KSB1 bacterium]MCB9511913.1 T9SS type A sorting domain-containing protein [Deferribacteres bacterium]
MKKTLTLSSIAVLITLFFMLRQPDAPQQHQPHELRPAVPMKISTKDDPSARLRWEHMRLQDPETGSIPEQIRKRELTFARKLPAKGMPGADQLAKSSQAKSLQWVHRGPYNVGGRTRALAVDVSNENVILAGGVSGGMWRSDDAGNSWQRTTDLAVLPSVTSIAQDTRPGKTNVWYYGTGELFGSAAGSGAPYRGDGIFKSTDGGFTWDILPATATSVPHVFDQEFDYVWNIVTDPSNTANDEVYAALYAQVKRSTDGGQTWQTVLGSFDTQFGSLYTELAISPTGVLYASLSQATIFFGSTNASTQGIFRSENGINWTEITPTDWPEQFSRVAIGIAPSNENIVYFLAETPGSGKNDHQIWKYTYQSGSGAGNGGVWEERTNNLPGADGVDGVGNFDTQGSYDIVVRVKPNNPDVVFIGGTNLYRSSDGFSTTSKTSWIGGYNASLRNYSLYPNHHPDQHAITFSPSNPNIMYSGHDGGVSRTTNNTLQSVSWQSLNNGYLTTQFYTVAFNEQSASSNLVLGGMQDNGTYGTYSTNPSTDWDAIFSGDGSFCGVTEDGSVLVVSAQNAQIYRLPLEEGVSSFARLDPSGLSESDYMFINPFVLDTNNPNIMYLAGGKSVWRNSDIMGVPEGVNKTSVNWDELTGTQLPNAQNSEVSALVTSTSPANILVYGTSTGEVYKLQNANSGQPTPIEITGSSFPQSGYVNSIAIDPTNANRIVVVFSNYNVQSLFYTSSGGDTWQPIGGNLEENNNGSGAGPSVRWVTILPFGGTTTYFAGTSTGLYSTSQLQGMSTVWELEGATSIGNTVVEMVKSRPTDGKVVAGTHGRGIFSSDITTGTAESGSEIPADFAMHPNYPNPFNPSTTISFNLPRTSAVMVKIYDSVGREVRTLVNASLPAGTHRQLWDGRADNGERAASGMYLVRMQAGDFVASRKIMLTK